MDLVRFFPGAVAVCALAATLAAAAAAPPYDFSGQWTGTASSRGASTPLAADFAATANPRKFTGSVALGTSGASGYATCNLTAKYTRKLKLHLRCSDGSKAQVTAQFEPTTQTLSGSFPFVGKHGNRHVATFMLMRTAG